MCIDIPFLKDHVLRKRSLSMAKLIERSIGTCRFRIVSTIGIMARWNSILRILTY